MCYQVPLHIDSNKIFIVNRSEIDGRLDPKMVLYKRKVHHSVYKKVRLKQILIDKPQYGASESGITRYSIEVPRYIRISDIDEYGLISNEELGVTAHLDNDKYVLHENDILIARSGATVGKAYIHKKTPYKCFYAGYLIRFRINPKLALPDFVFTYTQLNTYKEWVNAIQRPSGQPNINAEEYKSLEIPLPPIDIQNKIVSIIHTAYSKKYKKDSEAQQLLENIDTYLLDEFGIIFPVFNTDLKNRMFIINQRSIDNRWDPYYSQDYFRNAFTALESCRFPIVNLKTITKLITSGITPKSGGDAYTEDKINGIPFIRSGNISIDGELDFDDLLYLKPTIHETLMRSSQLQKNDILIAIVGATIGQVGIYLYDGKANINQAIALVRLKEEYDFQFIKELLKSSIGQLSLNRLKRPVARANINLEEISTIKVVLPPLDKQHEIALHIADIRQQAKALQTEGKAILEQAKNEVEQMLMGEA